MALISSNMQLALGIASTEVPVNLASPKSSHRLVVAISDMDRRSTSPSARFYRRSSLAEIEQRHLPAPEMLRQHRRHAQSFDHFQGFSFARSARCHEGNHLGTHGHHIPEDMISPRMPIPSPPARYDLSRLVAEELEDNVDGEASEMHRYACDQCPCNAVGASELFRPATGSWPPHYHGYALEALPSSPPIYMTPASDYPVPLPSKTIRVPSDSLVSSLTSLAVDPYSHHCATASGHNATIATPSGSEPRVGRGSSGATIYPEDSQSAAGALPAPPAPSAEGTIFAQVRRDLADEILAVHDVCLAATQRYLGALRANWALRNGEAVEQPAGGGEERHRAVAGVAAAAGAGAGAGAESRWTPYDRRAPRRRARRDADEEVDGGEDHDHQQRDSDDDDEEEQHAERHRQNHHHHHHRHQPKRDKNPIPAPTTSLLHNVHHICGLLWRRAQRDRDDVPGAEAGGCRAMARLHECAERVVVLHRAADLAAAAAADPGRCWRRVVGAGRILCRELGDEEGLGWLGGGGEEEIGEEQEEEEEGGWSWG